MFKPVVGFTLLMGMLNPGGLAAQDDPLHLALVESVEGTQPRDISLTTPSSGYLLLVHVAGGKVRVMFPGRPTRSAELAAGEYNVERLNANLPWQFGRGGTIVAAWSKTPIRTQELVRYGNWAVSDLSKDDFTRAPLQATVALATRLGATPDLLAVSVEYDQVWQGVASSENLASSSYRIDESGDQSQRVYRNFVKIQGRCASGTRDVTGAGETCSRPASAIRKSPPRVVTPENEPANPPNRPIYAPKPRTPPPASPAGSPPKPL